jgi:hypothetical protein
VALLVEHEARARRDVLSRAGRSNGDDRVDGADEHDAREAA